MVQIGDDVGYAMHGHGIPTLRVIRMDDGDGFNDVLVLVDDFTRFRASGKKYDHVDYMCRVLKIDKSTGKQWMYRQDFATLKNGSLHFEKMMEKENRSEMEC